MTGVQRYARAAGVLMLLSIVAGGFGEWYVPSHVMVSGDAAATARNILAHDRLIRWGFAGYLVEATCDISLTLILYVLLRPVSKNLALLAAFFRLVGTAVFAFAEFFYFAAPLFLGGADYLKAFSPDQLNALALMSFRVYGYGGGLFMVLYGIPCIVLGVLMVQSGYIPKVLGAVFALGGAGFVIRNFALVLAPAYASPALLLPAIAAAPLLGLWLLVRGVDVAKWQQRAAALSVTG